MSTTVSIWAVLEGHLGTTGGDVFRLKASTDVLSVRISAYTFLLHISERRSANTCCFGAIRSEFVETG